MKYVKHTRDWPIMFSMAESSAQIVCCKACFKSETERNFVRCSPMIFVDGGQQWMGLLAGKCDGCGALNLVGNPFVMTNVVRVLRSKEVKNERSNANDECAGEGVEGQGEG